MTSEGSADRGQPPLPAKVPTVAPKVLQSWAQEKLAGLGAENYTSAADGAPLALLGLTAFWSGDFRAVDEILAIATELAGPGPWSDDVTARVMLQRALAGVVAALRGDAAVAEQYFSSSIEPSGGRPVDEALIVALSMRASLGSEGQPDRALADVARARALALELGDVDLAAVALIGEGWALSELGAFEDSVRVFGEALETLPGQLERSVAQLRLAEVQLRMGDRTLARSTVDSARQTFLDADSRYWGARAVLLTGAIDRDRGGRWLRLARELSFPDPAYERLFLPDGVLSINIGSLPSVRRDGDPVEFLTRHAEVAVQLLAIAEAEGMSSKELIEIFWPDVSSDRQRARLRTLLWQARNSLGADAWRIQRKGDFVTFDATGVNVIGSGINRESVIQEFLSRRSS